MYHNKKVVAVELVGGAGTRLWPLVEYEVQSKATIRIAGKRLAYFNADLIEDAGIKNLVLPVQFNADEIVRKLKFEGYRFNKVFTEANPDFFPPDEQPRFRGTADAVLQSREHLHGYDYVVIVPCDHITNVELGELINRSIFNYENYGAIMTTAAVKKSETEIASAFGNMKIDANGKVIDWKEKPESPISDLAALGIYAGPVQPVLDAIENSSGHDFGKHVLPFLRKTGLLYAHFYPGEEFYWNDIGTPEFLRKAARDMIEGIKKIRIPYMKVNDKPTSFGGTIRRSLISPTIENPTIHGTVEDSVIGDYSVVDRDAKVTNSVLMGNNQVMGKTHVNDSVLGKYAYVSDSPLDECTLGRQVKLGGCTVGKGIRIHADAHLFGEEIIGDVRREDSEW